MALTIKLTPGYVYTDNELDTAAKRNALGNPTIELEGSIGTLSLADGSVTTVKLADGVLSADAAGRLKMQDNYFDSTMVRVFSDNFLPAQKADEEFRDGCQQYAVGNYAAGVYTVSLTPPATTYNTGMRVAFNPDTTNTGAASLKLNSLGAIPIKAIGTRDVDTGRIVANQIVEVIYDGTNFVLVNERNSFDLGETAIAAGLINVAHGMGRPPGVVNWRLRCHTGEFGYSSTTHIDEIEFPSGWGVQTGANDSTIYCAISAAAVAAIPSFQKSTPWGAVNLTANNWRIIAYARL
jgi:hypothetical protein